MRWRAVLVTTFVLGAWLGCSGENGDGSSSERGGSGNSGAGGGGGKPTAGGRSGGGDAGLQSSGGKAPNVGGSSDVAPEGGAGSQAIPAGWGCIYFAYGDGKCDCGCGAPDSDCEQQDLAHCEVCDRVGGCSISACPGRIDPDDVTECITVPSGWTCDPGRYADGVTCDCGCGVRDRDCSDALSTSCDQCAGAGSCATGPCPSSLMADDNARCEVPAAWSCDRASYGDGTCNCGCGVVDVDCANATAAACEWCDRASCSPYDCKVDENDNAHCSSPPATWNCSARLYRDGTQCDCGCGAVDPDCGAPALAACDKCDAPGSCSAHVCPGLIDPNYNARCEQPDPPPEWTCPPAAYADGISCDCGCGAVDLDCRNSDVSTCERCFVCGGHGECAGTIDPANTTQCAPPPPEWICSAAAYRDAICDCGCGLLDSFCQDIGLLYVCGNYPVEGCSAGNRAHIDPNHNYQCLISVPNTWTCNRSYYYDGLCDCGCGAIDLDCANNDVSVCGKCDDAGSCSSAACPGKIAANDIAHCAN